MNACANTAAAASQKQIARQLERTALGDGFYGQALATAKNFDFLNDADRAVIDRYASGEQRGTDHVQLQDVANKIRQSSVVA